jgi:hypothetical protein
MKCELRDICTFYEDNLDEMPVTALFYRKQYCEQDFEKCARKVTATALGYDQVPQDLLPCQLVRVRIITRGKVSIDSLLDNQEQEVKSCLSRYGTPSERRALQLLKQCNGDKVLALGACYAEVREKYPGYLFSDEPKPDDEFYEAHLEYISIRNLIHTLAEKKPAIR